MDDSALHSILAIVSAIFLSIIIPAIKGTLKKRSAKDRDIEGFLALCDLPHDQKSNIRYSLESKTYFGTSVPRAILGFAAQSPDPEEYITRYLTAKHFIWTNPEGRVVYRGWVESHIWLRWVVGLVCTLSYIGTAAIFALCFDVAVFGPLHGGRTLQSTLLFSVMAVIAAVATFLMFLLFRGFFAAVILRTYMKNHTKQDKIAKEIESNRNEEKRTGLRS